MCALSLNVKLKHLMSQYIIPVIMLIFLVTHLSTLTLVIRVALCGGLDVDKGVLEQGDRAGRAVVKGHAVKRPVTTVGCRHA
jgi:hypothetical protein